jgi:hypothetical protein
MQQLRISWVAWLSQAALAAEVWPLEASTIKLARFMLGALETSRELVVPDSSHCAHLSQFQPTPFNADLATKRRIQTSAG